MPFVRGRGARLARRLVAGAWLGAACLGTALAGASGVDGAGHVLVVPLVFAGLERSSLVTITNAGPEGTRVRGTYVGAEGTPLAASQVGPLACPEQALGPDESRTLPLQDLCPDVRTMDVENFGYLELTSRGDTRFTFFATSTAQTIRSTSFAVPGQPVGAFDPGLPPAVPLTRTRGLRAIGLRGDVPAVDETLACYFASLDEPKKLRLLLWDAAGSLVGAGPTLVLDPRRMQRLTLLPAFGLAVGHYEGLRLEVASDDPTLVIAGCGLERPATLSVAYQPAQTPEPLDRSRLRETLAETLVTPGPYQVGVPWSHTSVLSPQSRMVVLSTYLRPDDRVRCFLEQPSIYPSFDPRPWLELRVRDPLNNVVAGGPWAQDTGVFSTPSRGRYPAAAGLRFHVDVAFNKDAQAQVPWPQTWPNQVLTGGWAVRCLSASGMSALLPVDDPTSGGDF